MPHHWQALQLACEKEGCKRFFKTQAGRTKHIHSAHPNLDVAPPSQLPASAAPSELLLGASDGHQPERDEDALWDDEEFHRPQDEDPSLPSGVDSLFWGPGDKLYRNYHPKLDGKLYFSNVNSSSFFRSSARPCDEQGAFLDPGTRPAPASNQTNSEDWTPYRDRVGFEVAEFLFTRNQMSAPQIDILLDLWAAGVLKHGDNPPFANHRHLYQTIDSTSVGDIKWDNFSVRYTGPVPSTNPPPWMQQEYKVWFRNPRHVVHRILGNPSFAGDLDFRPFREYRTDGDTRQFQDFMSGDWAWEQAVRH